MSLTMKEESITPTKAKKWLEANHDNQRMINKSAVQRYAGQMERGEFMASTGQPLIFDVDDHLIDGQHRLRAIVQSGKTIKMLVVRNAVSEARKYIDHGLVRSPAHIMQIAGDRQHASLRISLAKALTNQEISGAYDRLPLHRDRLGEWEIAERAQTDEALIRACALVSERTIAQGLRRIGFSPKAAAYCYYMMAPIDTDMANRLLRDVALGDTSASKVGMACRNRLMDYRASPIDNSEVMREKQRRQLQIYFMAWNHLRRSGPQRAMTKFKKLPQNGALPELI